MKKISFIAMLFMCAFISIEAQNEMQALRYSRYNTFGTARYAAQGGAIGALGGDFSSIMVNPAGLGSYRSSEFSFSPSFYWVNTSSNFMGSTTDDSQLKFNVGSLGMVSAKNRDSKSGLAGASYALGYNTLVNFNNRTTTSGINNNSSMLDDFTWHANADPDNLSPFYEQLAFDTDLMPFDSTAGEYWHDMQRDGYGQQQYRLSEQSGYIGEYSISGAFNFSNLLYFGATFGIHSVRFYEEIYHTETDHDDHVLDFDSFRFREFNNTKGWGYTFRFGMIFRPVQVVRVGASFHIPTYYYLTDEKFTDMKSYFDSGSGIPDGSASSPSGLYDYRLKTPFHVNAHASVILFKMATFSAEYEYVDYSSSRLDAYDYKFFDENDRIRQDFQAAHNLKAGAEVRLGTLYLRAGTQYLMSPFTDTRNNAEIWIYSGGIGVRTKSAFFDISYSHSSQSEVYGMYAFEPGSNEVAINQVNGNNLMFTLGFKF
ncbi:MAG: hypothetical protein KAR19_09930 [Bacteroidales bacterium]|nr:hypothetical protein [Bacteroidales bacterium]